MYAEKENGFSSIRFNLVQTVVDLEGAQQAAPPPLLKFDRLYILVSHFVSECF